MNPPYHEVAGGEGVHGAGFRAVVAAPVDAVAAGGDVRVVAMSDAWERVLLPKSKYGTGLDFSCCLLVFVRALVKSFPIHFCFE